ncbi:hypothetical protein QMM98_09285, partial [Leptospira santarosai]|nr:hypothetical protein [Leptospira santarosai]
LSEIKNASYHVIVWDMSYFWGYFLQRVIRRIKLQDSVPDAATLGSSVIEFLLGQVVRTVS